MTLSRIFPVLLSVGAVAAVTMACGSSGDSSFGSGNGNGGAGDGANGANPAFGDNGQNGSDGTGGTLVPGSSTPACATTSSVAQGLPVYLVFMFDRSGSMKFNPAPNNKWDSCVAGLDAFFADPGSLGIHASIQVFPYDTGACSSSTYQKPIVDITPLPDATSALKAALTQNGPQQNYGTPTLPALQGAIAHAQDVQAKLTDGGKVAVVLVTDGDPNNCSSTPENVAAAAATVAKTIPTYVIGVGPETTKLDIVATGGGTAPAIIVSTNDPTKITADFEKAVAVIKGKAISCDYAMPAAPAGQTLDVNAVNVQYTPKGGAGQTLTYNKDCGANGQGWRYDNPTSPTKIEICNASCDTLKADTTGKLDILLGCHTQGVGPGGVAK